MKNLLRLGSLAGFLDPSQIHTTKTGRASGRTCRKSLIINDQILCPRPNRPEIPNLSEVIRSFALRPVLQTWQEWKTRTVTPPLAP